MKLPLLARLLLSLGAATLALAPLAASAYSNLVIFGDSLSDSGNNALVLGINGGQVVTGNTYVPTQPYGEGTYSDGEVWATGFAAALGLQALPSLAGGSNYAYGGAVTRGGVFPPSLRDQVGLYLGSTPADAADTLFVIAGGGNNARDALQNIAGGANPLLTINRTANRFAEDVGLMVDQLQAAGGVDIVVWNAPDLGLAPAVTALGGDAVNLGSTITGAMNGALGTRLAGEIGVITFDLAGLVGQVVADPAAFGLANAVDACGAVVGCDPSSYLFWDGIHPTSAGHAIVRDAMLTTIGVVPEPGTALLFIAGSAGLLAWRRRRA